MPERSLYDTLGNAKNIIVSGKGGVGKSTISASLALDFSQKAMNTIAVDMDASHSMGDSLGFGMDDIPEGTSFVDYNEHLKLYFLSKIIPSIHNDSEHHILNHCLDRLLNIDNSFLPLLRLALHPTFVGMPLPYEDAAYVVQLIDLFRKQSLYSINKDSLERHILEGEFDRKIFDTENTQGFMGVINSVIAIQNTLKNIHTSFYGSSVEKVKKTVTRQAIKGQDNLHKFAKSDLVRNYEDYRKDILAFHIEMVKASVVIVTQPGLNDLHQTMKDIEALKQMGFPAHHIIVNKFRDHFDKNQEATQHIFDILKDFANRNNLGISVVDSEFTIIDPSAPADEKQNITIQNLQGISETFE